MLPAHPSDRRRAVRTSRRRREWTLSAIEKTIARLGFLFALILIPALIIVRMFEIVTRSMNIPSSIFNAMESELFLLFAFLIIGAAYVSDSHVRVDIVHARFSPRRKAVVELFGIIFFVLPFAAIVLWFGSVSVGLVWEAGERTAIGLGTATRWVVVAATPVGIGLFTLAALCRAARSISVLAGRS